MTVAEIKAMRNKVFSAYSAALAAQSVNKNGRGITMQTLASLKSELAFWDRKLALATRKSKPYSLVKFTGG